jgi:uncharacterized protein (TIGR03086 family)
MLESTQPEHEAGSVTDGEQTRGPLAPDQEVQPVFPDPVKSRILQRACGSTGTILATLTTADLSRPTPCAMWTVRDIVNHVVGGAGFFAELAEAGEVGHREDDPDFTAGDFSATFRQQSSRLVAAFDAPGAMDAMMTMPFGGTPGSVCAYIAATDIFTHGWDLARATGQSTDLEPDLAGMLLARIMKTLPDSMRGPEGEAPFGPRVEVAESAPPADQLAAFQGRQP